MWMLPVPLLVTLLLGLFSLGLLLGGLFLLWRAYHRFRHLQHHHNDHTHSHDGHTHSHGPAGHTHSQAHGHSHASPWKPLLLGSVMLMWALAGGQIIPLLFPAGTDDPQAVRAGSATQLTRPDGTKLNVETYGPADAPPIILTHGWGGDSTLWYYAKRDLAQRFRVIVWDLPGLGKSTEPNDRNYALEKMAADLHEVVGLTGGRPTVLVGHSIGGMINLTYCRLYPQELGQQIAGIIQVNTTYTNPVKTTQGSGLSQALQKPVAEPLLHTIIAFSPLVQAFAWLNYQNGMAHLHTASSSFAGTETRGQVDFVARYMYQSSPAIVARGTLAMFHWDATDVLPRVTVPVLLLAGQQDKTLLPEASERMRQSMPQALLERESPAAHMGILEQHQRYDDAIARFADLCQAKAANLTAGKP